MDSDIRFLLHQFAEPELKSELESCKLVTLPADEYLLREGEYIKIVPLVIQGIVKVIREDENGKEILLYTITTGESCALSISACLSMDKSKAIAITETETVALLVSSDQVKNWMDRFSSWRKFVIHLYNQRFSELLEAFDDIAFRNIDDRLEDKIKEKQKLNGSNFIKITHQELADELGTAREVVSRLLKHMERSGKIKISRGIIQILRDL